MEVLLRSIGIVIFSFLPSVVFVSQAFSLESDSEFCHGDPTPSEMRAKARRQSLEAGYVLASRESMCGPTSVTNMDIDLGVNIDPHTGEKTSPQDLQKEVTECLKRVEFINDDGACNLLQPDKNAEKICKCNEEITGEQFECKGINFDRGGTWQDVQDILEGGQKCSAICFLNTSAGSGHVFGVTSVSDTTVAVNEPNGGQYSVPNNGDGTLGNSNDPLTLRMNRFKKKKGLKISVWNCVTKCRTNSKRSEDFEPLLE